MTASATGTCAATVRVTATDECGNASFHDYATRVDGTPPALTSGTIEACYPTAAAAEAAALAASGATDDCTDDPVLGATTTGTCDATVRVTATDECGNTSFHDHATRIDGAAPDVAGGTSPLYCLWPPNHAMVRFGHDDFAPGVADACSGPVTWRFTGCASNQPADDTGDGHTAPDCVVAPDGLSFEVRAERQGGEPGGRRYGVAIVAVDGCGNESAETVIGTIDVPHDQNPHRTCIKTTGGNTRAGRGR
jgi:hypothetical protein